MKRKSAWRDYPPTYPKNGPYCTTDFKADQWKKYYNNMHRYTIFAKNVCDGKWTYVTSDAQGFDIGAAVRKWYGNLNVETPEHVIAFRSDQGKRLTPPQAAMWQENRL